MSRTKVYYAAGFTSPQNADVRMKIIDSLYARSDSGTSGSDDMTSLARKSENTGSIKELCEKGALNFRPILSKLKKEEGLISFTCYRML